MVKNPFVPRFVPSDMPLLLGQIDRVPSRRRVKLSPSVPGLLHLRNADVIAATPCSRNEPRVFPLRLYPCPVPCVAAVVHDKDQTLLCSEAVPLHDVEPVEERFDPEGPQGNLSTLVDRLHR